MKKKHKRQEHWIDHLRFFKKNDYSRPTSLAGRSKKIYSKNYPKINDESRVEVEGNGASLTFAANRIFMLTI